MSIITLSNTYNIVQSAYEQTQTLTSSQSSSPKSFRNLIINGSMIIDQRNQGALITISSNNSFPTVPDRYRAMFQTSTTPSYTLQRTTLSNNTTIPSQYSLRLTCISNPTFISSSIVGIRHDIEGTFMKDLFWGTAAAKPLTLSAYVRTNQAGVHSFAVRNAASNMSYIMPFTVSTANTWQLLQSTISGPTSGSWGNDSNIGATLFIDTISPGLSNANTNSWLSGNFVCPSTYSNLEAGNYFEVSSLQLEKGSSKTDFEYRPYPLELQLCHRYYETCFPNGMAPSNNTFQYAPGVGMYLQGQFGASYLYFEQPKRAIPTMTYYNPWNSNGNAFVSDTSYTSSLLGSLNPSIGGFSVRSTDANLQNKMVSFNWAADAEL